jgi:hypothetical protein
VEDLIKDIQQRTGLPADKVLEVVTMVTDYLRNALPDDLVRQVTSYLGAAADSAGNAAGTARTTASSAGSAAASGANELVGRAGGLAASALTTAKDVISDMTARKNDA